MDCLSHHGNRVDSCDGRLDHLSQPPGQQQVEGMRVFHWRRTPERGVALALEPTRDMDPRMLLLSAETWDCCAVLQARNAPAWLASSSGLGQATQDNLPALSPPSCVNCEDNLQHMSLKGGAFGFRTEVQVYVRDHKQVVP